ncbi:MAG: flagellar hook-associated protein 3 [Anaerolinea sp.]|nr:flagellar hook-associated protein 3 [Anaerolinea sp.]
MRITNRMLHDRALANLGRNLEALARVQEQVSTTKRLLRPSDSPIDVRLAVKASDAKAEIAQYQRNVAAATRATSAADTALGSAGDLVQRARELAIQAANGTLSAQDRQSIALEVEELTRQLVGTAAARIGDGYLFSGYMTDTAPYAPPPPGSAAVGPYLGDSGTILIRVGPTAQIGVNVTADAVFGPAFAALGQLHAELIGGGPVSGATIALLDGGQNALLTGRSVLGARQNRLEAEAGTLEELTLASQRLLSELVDVDLTEAITELAQREAVYQAALEVNARILQPSLIDRLR